ncbi:MAG TPA: 2-oxo-4-hydroxy-4-carboxy-5-ureidoimidazoline decarboxylase [Pseudonocardiaceae bacterium]|nr:2-oxo-4-hydroxy-4-carboxy-5-ureidoimidazoline decarboxylase [Pseudonocardiaceae bacterium]
MEDKFRIAELNQLPFNTLTDLFGQCVAVERWARELADSRPYADVAALLTRADELSASLTDKELRQALGDHPRIGQRAAPGSATADMSAAEQSGVDVKLADRLLAANTAYEVRFDHIYLVCAAGRDGEELLADLADRMGNDPAAELLVVRRELGKIARLRLAGMITP